MTSRLVFPLTLGSLGALVLVCLGIWQVQRLEWKQGILATIEERVQAAPLSLPSFPDRQRDSYLAVEAVGRILGPELLVLSSSWGIGPGFRIIVPFETGGRRILLDRGFVPEMHRDSERAAPEVRVVGNLLWPDEHDRFFTPEPEGSLWFARDLAAMAGELKTEPVLVVVRESSFDAPNIHRWPVDGADVPNDHFQYAVTWFSLALVWIGMTAFWVRRIIGVHAR